MLLGAEKVTAKLKTQSLSGRSYFNVHVGYRAPYAVKQHEDLTLNHPNGGEAKFLERPVREMRAQMRATVRFWLKKKKRSLEDGTLAACNQLLEASKKRVPVDSGFLRDSGYVEIR